VAVAVAVEDVRTPDTPLVACPRPLSTGRTSVHWVGRTSGVHATGVHATGAILVSGRTPSGDRGPGVRAVRTALDPGMRRCGGAAHIWARRVRYVAVVGEWPGRRCPNCGLAGKGWSWVRLCLAPTGSTADRSLAWIRGGSGVALPPGRHGSCPAQGADRLAGHEQEQLLTRRPAGASWTGCRCDGRLGREMLITLRGRCAGVVRLRRAHSVR
jgi:hypothetical protein